MNHWIVINSRVYTRKNREILKYHDINWNTWVFFPEMFQMNLGIVIWNWIGPRYWSGSSNPGDLTRDHARNRPICPGCEKKTSLETGLAKNNTSQVRGSCIAIDNPLVNLDGPNWQTHFWGPSRFNMHDIKDLMILSNGATEAAMGGSHMGAAIAYNPDLFGWLSQHKHIFA